MTTYLGLGSNLGDRRGHLARGVSALAAAGLRDVRVSPVVETPALLPERASSGWNLPFLNLVLSAVTDLSPDDLLALARRIQDELGGSHESRWAPRALDIDILLVEDLVQRGGQLVLPQPFMHQRGYGDTRQHEGDAGKVDRARRAERQAGSSFKPIVYAGAIDSKR